MGTSRNEKLKSVLPRDHPHAYGDKGAFTAVGTASEGSSPRVWGQVKNNLAIVPLSRIIPTRMGTSMRIFSANKK